MASKTPSSKKPQEPTEGKKGGKESLLPKLSPQSFWGNILSTVFVLLLIASIYSYFAAQSTETTTIPLTQLSTDVKAGQVKDILIEGNDLTATYKDASKKLAKKETDAALTDTLIRYGVTPAQLEAVAITVKSESGFRYWVLTLAPFLIPVVALLLFVWFLSRQVKGAGMQAFSFGSKPSISTKIWLSVCSRSSFPPPTPVPRTRPTASISSTNTIAGAARFAI